MDMQSESVAKIVGALALARGEFEAIKKTKNGRSGNQHYKYADLSDVLESVVPHLSTNGLVHVQTNDYQNNQTLVVTTLYHSSGEWIRGVLPVPSKNPNDPKALGSAITYARRYALCGILGISAEEDDDGDAAQKSKSNDYRNQGYQSHSKTRAQKKKPTIDQLKARALKDHPKINGEMILDRTDYCVSEGPWEGKAIDEVPEWQNLVVNSIRGEARGRDFVDVLLKFNGEEQAVILQAMKHYKIRHDAKAEAKSHERRGSHKALQKQIAGN